MHCKEQKLVYDSLGTLLKKEDIILFFNNSHHKLGLEFGVIKKITLAGSLKIKTVFGQDRLLFNYKACKNVVKCSEEQKKLIMIKKIKEYQTK